MEVIVYEEDTRRRIISFSQRIGLSNATDMGVTVPQIGHEFYSFGIHYIVKRVVWHVGIGIPYIEVLCERLTGDRK